MLKLDTKVMQSLIELVKTLDERPKGSMKLLILVWSICGLVWLWKH